MGCYSFLVRLFHPLLYAGLSRRYPDQKVRPTNTRSQEQPLVEPQFSHL